RIVDNVLSYSGKWNVHTWWRPGRGRDNVVARNCFWRGFRRNVVGDGFAAYGNLVAAPRYKHRPAVLTMRPGPCFAKRPRPSRFDTTDAGFAFPKVRPFLVHWTVRALRTRVQIVTLELVHVAPGAQAEVRCRSGCSIRESLTAGADG